VGDHRSVPLSRGALLCVPYSIDLLEVVGVSLVDVEDEVGLGVWDSLHNVVMVECLSTLPST